MTARDMPPRATCAPRATRPAAMWGLPGWRDPAAYGEVQRWGLSRWRWEFLRRREDVRAAFDERAEETFLYWRQYGAFPTGATRPLMAR